MSLVRTLPGRERARPEYWAALSAAGGLLLAVGEEREEVERALQECRRRAAEDPLDEPGVSRPVLPQ
ncbi:hypothetical protein GCM10011579_081540 [Streptomyces albiflavescens]|uniref:Uncharacterized protein n=1 Tax=Streptomyces albiflavescens TaxID=1623582 RepID=A0A917YEK0_9ACTN|nr:hypothetical protein [Streptomyces albiflavescens]GGN88087.1 hypothetical protein GCM10011579_081540 [Streptomyces albiflavescens]